MSLCPSVRQILPEPLVRILGQAISHLKGSRLQTIRLRRNKPVSITIDGRELFLTRHGFLEDEPTHPVRVSTSDLETILSLATQGSLYAVESELRRGYLTLPGGHRLGIAGEAVVLDDSIRNLKHISSLQLRIAHQIKGCADELLSHLLPPQRIRPLHTLIIGPPGSGKTTILRDLARQLSDGDMRLGRTGLQIGIADERSEIAGTFRGTAQLDVGQRTDVIDGAPKAEAMGMLVRSMAPDVVVTDEIGALEDATAVADVLRCGVTLIASAHATDVLELQSRPLLNKLLDAGAFQCIAVLSGRNGVGTLEEVVQLRPPHSRARNELRPMETVNTRRWDT